MNKRANAVVFLIGILVFFLVGIMYIILREAADEAVEVVNRSNYAYEGTDYEDSVNKLYGILELVPGIVLFTLLLWMLVQSARRSPEYFGES